MSNQVVWTVYVEDAKALFEKGAEVFIEKGNDMITMSDEDVMKVNNEIIKQYVQAYREQGKTLKEAKDMIRQLEAENLERVLGEII